MKSAHRVYRLLTRLLAPVALAWFAWRAIREPGYAGRLGERLGFVDVPPEATTGVLVHAASVGEVQAAAPLIRSLLTQWPAHLVTVSTMTPTGARALRDAWGDQIRHVYLPLDTPGATRRFLDRVQPALVVLIERELWPELLAQCRQRCIPVALVSARLSERSVQTYRRFRGLFEPVWQHLALVATADSQSLQRYRSLGVPEAVCRNTGNLKFDQPPPETPAAPEPSLQGRFVVVAGSTHDAEEDALLARWPALASRHPRLLLVLVPRHPQRFEHVAGKLRTRQLPFVRFSAGETPTCETAVWLGDTMGHLPRWYGQADLCFVGGSLEPVGGHNPLEAMVQGRPVVYGPHTHNFEQLYGWIDSARAGLRVDSADALAQLIDRACSDTAFLGDTGERGLALAREHQGATARTLQALSPLWAGLDPALLGRIAVSRTGRDEVWHDPARTVAPTAADFDPRTLPAQAGTLATGSGRGQVHVVRRGDTRVVLRHYRRGGLVARFSEDRFWGARARNGRSMKEFLLLRRLLAWHLPVPAPVAALTRRHGLWHSADIMVELLPDTRNVVQCLAAGPLPPIAWQAVGAAIRRMHDHQVFHADLNAHNLLLDAEHRAWVVDFDKCEVRHGEDWKSGNLARLLRSLRKESSRQPVFHWNEADWQILLDAYAAEV